MTLLEQPLFSTLPSIPTISTRESVKSPPDLRQVPLETPTKSSGEHYFSVPDAKSTFVIEEHPVDEVRPIKVGIIGAGLTGVSAGILLPAKLPGLDLRIYDKNADVVSLGSIFIYPLSST